MILLALPALAQDAVAPGLLEAVLPQLLELLGVVLMLFLTWASARFTRRTGIEIEARHRAALHSALMSGARLAISRQMTGPAAVELILSQVRGSVPDAIERLRPNGAVLERLAEAKLQEAGDKLASELTRAIRALSRTVKTSRPAGVAQAGSNIQRSESVTTVTERC